MTTLAIRRFTAADQARFARLSGDTNLIHLDALGARRELYGRRILHGLHGTLVAVEALFAGDPSGVPRRLTRCRARFLAPVFLHEPVAITLVHRGEREARLEVRRGDQVLYEIDVGWATGGPEPGAAMPASRPLEGRQATVRELASLRGLHLELPLELDDAAFRQDFPGIAHATSTSQRAAMLAVTRLVGMESPGAQSLLSSFDLAPTTEGPPLMLRCVVTAADARFSLVKMDVTGGGLAGKVEAFWRPLRATQPAFADLAALVPADAFAGARALVVGGSRGLGEVAAKAIAAGGGDVVLTYRRLRDEARRVAHEIRAGGGRARVLRWDALAPEPAASALARRAWAPTHLLYFATERMHPRKPAGFSAAAFHRLARLYVDGLIGTVRACRSPDSGPLVLFVPSAVLVEQPPRGSAELAAAKLAGEVAARALAQQDRAIRLAMPRLPRLATDQAQSLVAAAAEPTTALLPHLLALTAPPAGALP